MYILRYRVAQVGLEPTGATDLQSALGCRPAVRYATIVAFCCNGCQDRFNLFFSLTKAFASLLVMICFFI